MLRVPKRGVVDVKLVSFPCPVEIGVVRRPLPPIETDFRMCFHFTLPEHLLSPALPFPLVARHPLSREEAHDVVVIDLSLLKFGRFHRRRRFRWLRWLRHRTPLTVVFRLR